MSKSNKQYKQLKTNDKEDYINFKTVFFYCLLIILLPIAAFFLTKTYIFDGFLQLDTVKSNIYSAVAAVLALHFALGLYIYRAYSDNKVKKEIQQKLE
uniref:Vacuolar ATPase assembly integral membrane protein VMA21 homolog n=1 Tax=Culicoides sonorensis TaxID=179676 RepID=A0A336LHA1_CULSO